MRAYQLILRNVSQHRLSSVLTLLSVALGALLLSAILLLRAATENSFFGPSRGFSLVVGPPGSRLELVLNTIFQIGQSPGLLAYDVFEELEKNPSTELAVPYAVGDAFRGFRVVGTSDSFFSPRFPHPAAAATADKFSAGRPFRFDPGALRAQLAELAAGAATSGAGLAASNEGVAEAVLGANVARQLDIRIGDQIEPTHGVDGAGVAHEHAQLWTVVGILQRSGTPVDDLVLINLDSFFRIPDHRGGIIPESGKPAISAVVLFPKPGVHKALLLGQLNKRTQLQVADVDGEVRRLLHIVGNVDRVFFVIAALVVWIGVVSVAVGIYNTLAARQRELAILRILGARRRTLFGMLVGEATLLSALGGALGLLLGHLIVAAGAGLIERSSGVRPRAWLFLPEEALAYLLLIGAGALSGLLPATRAYRSDAAANLAPLS
ncbi:MAG TPA: FtsX-like permease family protein [Polyangiaceae bacterium]|nr:FtsX-like permease family protein [Polyangiaceae bacterium]